MKSKKHFKLSLFLLAAAFLIVAIALIFMPKTVPVHYNIRGNIDRYGSKFEFLILPALGALLWLIFHLLAKKSFKENEANRSHLYLASAYLLFVFIVLEIIFIILAFNHSENIPSEDIIYKTINVILGLFCIVIGNIMPKMTRNKVMGLRTTWSLYNDNTWNKSQRYGGFAFVGTGFIIIVASIFVPGIYNLLVLFLTLIFGLVLSIILSYKVYKEEKAKEKTTS